MYILYIGTFLCDGAFLLSQPNLLLPQRAVGMCGEARHQREDRLITLSNFIGKLDDIKFNDFNHSFIIARNAMDVS